MNSGKRIRDNSVISATKQERENADPLWNVEKYKIYDIVNSSKLRHKPIAD